MEAMNYTSIGPVLQLNKAGELTQKRMKAVKVCDGLYISEPDKNGYMQFICELNDVIWLDCKAAETKIAYGIKRIPGYFKDIKAGCFDGKNIEKFRREISRRINRPDSPVIMELKKPERKKPAPLAENERKVSVLMLKGRTDEITEKRVVIAEVVPHVYTYTYKLKRYGERVKIIFEIDGVYFQGHDTGANVLEREDFTDVCTKAYRLARKNVADGAASGMQYFIEVQKRMDAATPTETPRISTQTAETVNVSAEGENAKNEPEIIIRRRAISKANNGKMVLFHKRTEWANFWYAYEEDALTLCRACGHDPKTYGLSFIPLSDGSRGYPIMIFTDEFGKPGLSKIPPEILDENCVVVEKDMQAQPQSEPREAGNKPTKERMKSYARITGQHNRLWLAANGNRARQDRITAIWHRYIANISRHFKNPFMSEWDAHGTDELPRSIYAATNAPQSPEAPQIVECIADTPKPRETARKPRNRGIGSTRHSRLGANGYTMLDNASATLTAMSVPRECSTADYW